MLDLRLFFLLQPENLESPWKTADAAIRGGVTALQIRSKSLFTRELFTVARSIAELCREHQIPLLINDRLDVALAMDAAGVHLGPKDLPLPAAQKILEKTPLVLGASVRTAEQAQQAEQAGASYLGVGAFRSTSTKPQAQVVGLAGMTRIRQSTHLPLVAIGGILPEDAPALKGAGVQGMAVLSGIAQAKNVRAAAETYRVAWDSA